MVSKRVENEVLWNPYIAQKWKNSGEAYNARSRRKNWMDSVAAESYETVVVPGKLTTIGTDFLL